MPRLITVTIVLTIVIFCCPAARGQNCTNWLNLPPTPASSVQIGDLDVSGTQITVEAEFCRTTPYTGGPLYAGDLVSKHMDPTNTNYLLRPNEAEITTSDGYFQTPPVCGIELNKTYQVAFTYDGNTLKFYRNGVLMSQIAATGTLYQNDIPTRIGFYFAQLFNTAFIGYINEVRIWNVVRTQAQIQQYMNTTLPTPTTQPGLLAYYVFDDLTNKQGNSAWNASINGNAAVGATNPYCTASNPLTFSGSNVCLTPGTLTFSEQGDPGPFNITYTDGSQTYTADNINNGVPFQVQVQPTVTTTYTLLSVSSTIDCQPVAAPAGIMAIINPNSVPAPDFAFSQDVCNPLNVTFTANSEPDVSYSWNINGTNNANPDPANPNLTFAFPEFGTYPITLNTTGTTCPGTTAKNVVIGVQPADIIKNVDTTICPGKTVPLRTTALLDFCWLPATGLDNPSSPTPNATPPSTTTYYLTAKTTGANLVINGNFESGNTGFSSAYQYNSNGVPAATYFVGPSPNAWNPGAPTGCGDHTTGSGNMMLINGSTAAGVNVWSGQPMTVTPNTNYAFSVWIQSVSPLSPAILQFSINGTVLGNSVTASASTCLWQQFYTTWNSGNSTTATISLVNNQTAFSGNDFALDDISFAPVAIQVDSVVIAVDTPHVSAFPADTIVCPGMPVPLRAIGSVNYSWSPADGLSNPAIANPVFRPASADPSFTLTVTGTSIHGCVADTTITISQYPRLITISPDTLICRGDAAQLRASGGGTYQWSPAASLDNPASPDPTARPDSSTRFVLTLSDINQCSEQDSVTVRLKPSPTFHAPPNQLDCIGFGVSLKSDNPVGYVYSWSPATGLDNPAAPYPVASPSTDITYTLLIGDSLCTRYDSSFQVAVTVKPSPTVTAAANNIDCAIHTSQLTATGAVTYTWTPATGLSNPFSATPIASIDNTTTFIVKGVDGNGCYALDSVTVKVTPTGANTFVVPNAFSPNGDGHNDCFGVTQWGDVQLEELQIYDRWGVRVFETRNPADCWDGTFRGKPQPAGAYPYVIKAHTYCGEIFRKGVVMLVR